MTGQPAFPGESSGRLSVGRCALAGRWPGVDGEKVSGPSMAREAVATATAVRSMDVVKEYGTGPSAVRAVRKANVLALSLLIVALGLWDTPQALMPRPGHRGAA